ncbi:MAG: sialate O-acetylesterase [Planctomycetaceae bacterium]|jgi:sialate O-acetylesterase|nr:sialate O-acetylesterase [Planctomycetaceae bacterium]
MKTTHTHKFFEVVRSLELFKHVIQAIRTSLSIGKFVFTPLYCRCLMYIGYSAIFVVLFASTSFSDVKLPDIFAPGMVLQRGLPVPVWGWADPQEKITVTINEQSQTTETNADGYWQVQLKPLQAGKPTKLIIKGKNEIVLENILIGEVWLCSGQSNMEWSMNKHPDSKADVPSVNNPNIRLFQVRHETAGKPQNRLTPNIVWQPANPKSVGNFSSIGYYFGEKLNAELGVPIGLIDSSWGGTRIEPWTPVVGFKSVPSLASLADVKLPANPRNDKPTALYNKMIHPLVPLAIRGSIWYQGEANLTDGMQYAEKMKALINGWRKVFNNDELGFYYVQLAPFKYGAAPTFLPRVWEAQAVVEKQLNKTGMVVINDIGNINDIHPRNKKIVADRLAAQALNKSYGKKDIACESPKFDKIIIDGAAVIVNFIDVKEFKTRDGKSPSWFEIAGSNGEYHKAEATIVDKTKIKLTSSNVANPVNVRFAWHQIAEPNLQNEAGLQLGAFRTDKEN